MNPLYMKSLRIFVCVVSMLLASLQVKAQSSLANLADIDSITVSVNNIVIDGELSLRGLTADFPYPVLSTISLVNSNGEPVLGLADTTRWLSPNEITEIGLPISQIWNSILEFHLDDPAFPANPNVYDQEPEPLFTEVRQTTLLPTTTMLVMDASGSMRPQFEDAKQGARLYVDQMRPVDRAGVIVFASTIKGFQPITDDKNLLLQTINAAEARNETALYDALMLAIQELKVEGGRRGVIVYTDGKDNASVNTPDTVIDSARVSNVPIFTIALGDSTNETNLVRVAEGTGGLFFKVATAQEMQEIYIKLAQLIQNFYLMAHTSPDPIRNDTWRVVDVSVNVAGISGRGNGRYFVGRIPPPPADMEILFSSVTDTFDIVGNDTVNAVAAGDTFEYVIDVQNLGPNSATNIEIFQFLPNQVRFLSSSIPVIFNDEIVRWHFDNFAVGEDTSISVMVEVAPQVPKDIPELFSSARITSDNDPNQDNNFAADTVRVLFAQPSLNFDLQMTQQAVTDTTIMIDGEIRPGVLLGEAVNYTLTVANLGPAVARSVTISDALPDSTTASNFSIPPSNRVLNSLFWQFDSLAAGESITIGFEASVSDSIILFPFELLNIAEVFAEKDTNSVNDSTATTVYAFGAAGRLPQSDISITQTALTDSFTVIGADTVRFARAGEMFPYILTVKNETAISSGEVSVTDFLPDFVTAQNFDRTPDIATADSIRWNLGFLSPQSAVSLRFEAVVSQNLPIGKNLLINEVQAFSRNEDPNLLANNTSVDTVFNLNRPAGDVRPLIEARPPQVTVGDSISVRVQVRVPNQSWDLWVRFADGSIDSMYANQFIQSTSLLPGQWFDVSPRFGNTRLVTDAEREDIVFELRTVDVFDDFRSAQANVEVQSSNNLVLERNVFAASREGMIEVRFRLSSNREARLDLFDLSGSHVTKLSEGFFNAGWNTLPWNGLTDKGEKVGSGLYVITLRSGGFHAMRKLMVVR